MLIGLIIGIVAFVLDGQLAYFTAGQSLDLLATLLTLSGFLLFAGALTAAAQASRTGPLPSVNNDERVSNIRFLACQFGFATVMVLQIVMLPGADLVRGMTGIEPAMSTAASLALMTGLAAALDRFLNLNR
jgi:hypothetical protein